MEKEVDAAIDVVGHFTSTVNSLLGRREAARLVGLAARMEPWGPLQSLLITSTRRGCRPYSQQVSPTAGRCPGRRQL